MTSPTATASRADVDLSDEIAEPGRAQGTALPGP